MLNFIMLTAMSHPIFKPLYEQIKLLITQSLIAGEWHPGDAIPSEVELAKRFKVSQGTVRKAIDELAEENILVRRQGKGTFVATHSEEGSRYRFLRITRLSGKKEFPENRILDFARIKADKSVAARLGLKTGSALFMLHRVLLMSGKPVILDIISLPTTMFKGLTAAMISDYTDPKDFKGTLYSLYETRFGIPLVRVEERLRAVAADQNAAASLGVKEGSPLLKMERVAYTYGDKPVEYRESLVDTECHCYLNELG